MDSSRLSAEEERLLGLIEEEEVVSLLQALVRACSDYPPGDTRAALQIVADKLSQEGLDLEILAKSKAQPNLLARLSGSPDSVPGLLYHAHIDTVPGGNRSSWTVDPFGGDLLNGRIFGRGAGDDKGSVAAQTMSLVTLARDKAVLREGLALAVVSDEESGGELGTKWLHDAGRLACRCLVVGEQTDNRVAVAERVACGIDLTVHGKSAHGAMPWAGENAVLRTARALSWLEDRLFPSLEARSHPFLPPPTLNVGMVQGGTQWNIVPDVCTVKMDRRLQPGETRERALAEIGESLDAFSEKHGPLRYSLSSDGEVAGNVDTPQDDPFVEAARRTLGDVSTEDRPLTGYVQTSDGRWFARDGIPIIIFGPSDPVVAHGADEHVSVDQLVEATRFYTLLAFRWLNMPA